jgi:hypothetical protein
MLFVRTSGSIKVSKINSKQSYIEQDGGYYVVPANTVYRAKNGADDNIVIVIQNRIIPYGQVQSKNEINKTMAQIDLAKLMGLKLDIDSEFGRILREMLKNPAAVLLILIGVGLLLAMASGG